MKIAIISDVHANILALDACVDDARRAGAMMFVLLGDFVGYGPEPAAVLERIRALADAGAVLIKGNHDAMACGEIEVDASSWGGLTAVWTRTQLSDEDKRFLAHLPMHAQIGQAYFTHASAYALGHWHYVDGPRAAQLCIDAVDGGYTHVFVGHVHHQTMYYAGRSGGMLAFAPVSGVEIPTPTHRRWLCTVGSAGQPRDGDVRAMYVLFDSQSRRVCFRRVAYDHGRVAERIRHLGLAEQLALRMETGR